MSLLGASSGGRWSESDRSCGKHLRGEELYLTRSPRFSIFLAPRVGQYGFPGMRGARGESSIRVQTSVRKINNRVPRGSWSTRA